MTFEQTRTNWATGETPHPLGELNFSNAGKGLQNMGEKTKRLSNQFSRLADKKDAYAQKAAVASEKAASQQKAQEELPGHYRRLGIDPGASARELREAYAAKVKQYHPKSSGLRGAAKQTAAQHLRKVDLAHEAIRKSRGRSVL
jgi:hypothetical protein